VPARLTCRDKRNQRSTRFGQQSAVGTRCFGGQSAYCGDDVGPRSRGTRCCNDINIEIDTLFALHSCFLDLVVVGQEAHQAATRRLPSARAESAKNGSSVLAQASGEKRNCGTWYAKQNPPTAPVRPAIHIDGALICGSRDVPAASLSSAFIRSAMRVSRRSSILHGAEVRMRAYATMHKIGESRRPGQACTPAK
jgi:hypothetical protein